MSRHPRSRPRIKHLVLFFLSLGRAGNRRRRSGRERRKRWQSYDRFQATGLLYLRYVSDI